MSTKYTNLTYAELMELAPRDKPFQVVVQSNPYGEGGKQTLWANTLQSDVLDTVLVNQSDIDDVEYSFISPWRDDYKGTFDLIIHHLDDTTLEKFQVGDEVEILECARPFITKYSFIKGKMPIEDIIGTANTLTILKINVDKKSMLYTVGDGELVFETFPHICLRKVVNKEV